MNRAKTEEELREEFLEYIRLLSTYWANMPNKTSQEKCDGLAFSILNIFDGTTTNLPAFDLVAMPHDNDEQWCKNNNKNWIKPGTIINNCVLHDLYYNSGD